MRRDHTTPRDSRLFVRNLDLLLVASSRELVPAIEDRSGYAIRLAPAPSGTKQDVCGTWIRTATGVDYIDTAFFSPYPRPATATWWIKGMPYAAAASERRGAPSPTLLAKPITAAGILWLLGMHEACVIRTQAQHPLHATRGPAR